jgi:hypothetical protein
MRFLEAEPNSFSEVANGRAIFRKRDTFPLWRIANPLKKVERERSALAVNSHFKAGRPCMHAHH